VIDQGVNQFDWTASFTEPADHDGRAIEHICYRLFGAGNLFVHHC